MNLVTYGYGNKREIVTYGYGGVLAFEETPGPPDTPWLETVCAPTSYVETECAPAGWGETGESFDRISLAVPAGTFREALWLSPIEPPPPVMRLGGTRPQGKFAERDFVRFAPDGAGRFLPRDRSSRFLVTPAGTFRESRLGELVLEIQGNVPTEDVFLEQLNPNLNFGSTTVLRVQDSTIALNRVTLIRFLNHGLSPTATISSATLSLWMLTSVTQTTPVNMVVNRMLEQGWTEFGATWNNANGSPWPGAPGADSPGTDYSNAAQGSLAVSGTYAISDRLDIDVTSVVQEMVAAADTHLEFRVDIDAPSQLWNLRSASDSITTETPRITIVYTG